MNDDFRSAMKKEIELARKQKKDKSTDSTEKLYLCEKDMNDAKEEKLNSASIIEQEGTLNPTPKLDKKKKIKLLDDEIVNIGPMDGREIDEELLKTDRLRLGDEITKFLKRLLFEQGRQSKSKALHLETAANIKIFFKMLKRDTVPLPVFSSVMKICIFMRRREYVNANDCYLKLAIGNAPWPIGVTAVCIHERSSQSKITSANVARTIYLLN